MPIYCTSSPELTLLLPLNRCHSSIMSDSTIFEQPEIFQPERFLKNSASNLDNFMMAFGFGRRKCPGEKLALNSMFIMISRFILLSSVRAPSLKLDCCRILWAFNVVPALDPKTGSEIGISQDFVGGLIRRPANLKYRLVARRSEKQMDLIYGEAEHADAETLAWT